jgi:hypothetical protein
MPLEERAIMLRSLRMTESRFSLYVVIIMQQSMDFSADGLRS